MPTQAFKIKPNGVNTDVPAQELGEEDYSDVQNMAFRAEGCVRADGYGDVKGVILDNPNYVIGNIRPNVYYWLYPGADTISVTDQENHLDITPAVISPTDPGAWTGGALNDLMMLCNGADAPFWWDGQPLNPVQPLPNFPALTVAKWIRPFKYFAIAGGITSGGVEFPNQFYWSASVDPGLPPQVWTPLPDNDAGDNILAGTEGGLIDGYTIRDNFVLAKTHSLYLMNYVAGNFVFNITKLSVTTGVLTSNCMQEYEGRLFIFADGDIIVTDGQALQSIAAHRVKNTIFSEMNQNFFHVCHVALFKNRNEMWFCYPTGAEELCDKAAVYDLVDGTWGFRDIPHTAHIAAGIASNTNEVLSWDLDNDAWVQDVTQWSQTGISEINDGLMMASKDDTGHLYGVEYLSTQNGTLMPAYVEKLSMDFGDFNRVKLVTRLWLYALGTINETLLVRIGVQQNESDPITWSQDQTFIIGADDKLDFSEAGRLISVRVSGSLLNRWRVYSFQFNYSLQGLF